MLQCAAVGLMDVIIKCMRSRFQKLLAAACESGADLQEAGVGAQSSGCCRAQEAGFQALFLLFPILARGLNFGALSQPF